MSEPLTRRQAQVMGFILSRFGNYGQPPSVDRIAAEMGIKRANSVRDQLRTLERKGYIRLSKGFQIELTHADKRNAVVEAARDVESLDAFAIQFKDHPHRVRLREALAALDAS